MVLTISIGSKSINQYGISYGWLVGDLMPLKHAVLRSRGDGCVAYQLVISIL